MGTIIGSSRHDENGKYLNGVAGDQLQKLTNGEDFSGEVSFQYLKDFIGKRAWFILRPKRADHAIALAEAMRIACNNKNIGYDQNQRNGIVTYGVDSTRPTEADCGSTVRACIKKATGKDVGNFTTGNEESVLVASGLFDKAIIYRTGTKVYEGDVFVTQKKGHTGICVEGLNRSTQKAESFSYSGVDYSPVFNPTYYATKNPDVKADAYYGKNNKTLFEHFCKHGMSEGRQACLTFNPLVYMERYEHLKSQFGNNYAKYYTHYCVFGIAEGKKGI